MRVLNYYYNKPNKNCSFELKICIPISIFLKCFELAHSNPMSGHRGDANTLKNIRFFTGLECINGVTMLIHDCLDCQKNKSKSHDLNEAPLQQWGELVTTPFYTIHIDHKGPFRHSSNDKHYCFVVVDSSTLYSPWTNRKVKIQNKHLTNYLRHFLKSIGNNWAKHVGKFAFAHNTEVNYSTGYTP